MNSPSSFPTRDAGPTAEVAQRVRQTIAVTGLPHHPRRCATGGTTSRVDAAVPSEQSIQSDFLRLADKVSF